MIRTLAGGITASSVPVRPKVLSTGRMAVLEDHSLTVAMET